MAVAPLQLKPLLHSTCDAPPLERSSMRALRNVSPRIKTCRALL